MPQAYYYVGSGSGFGWAPFIFIAFIVLRIFISSSRAHARRERERDRNREGNRDHIPAPTQHPPSSKPDFSQFDAGYRPPPADFRPPEDSPASRRSAAEQSRKRRLEELDELRRAGRISADEYAAAREEIFRTS
ncbi:MAG: hypothetical protein M3017_02765 [Actinomycetota bacterium]|nr:hypothetical protein [Actinomycetota bacterium]